MSDNQNIPVTLEPQINENEISEQLEKLFEKLQSKTDEASAETLQDTIADIQNLFGSSGATEMIQKMYETLVNLDTAMTNIRKSFRGSNAELESMYHNAARLGKEFGVTAQAVLEQESVWSAKGYNTGNHAEQMTGNSLLLTNISPDVDTEQAVSGLSSIAEAYALQSDDVKRKVIDNISAIGSAYATTNGEIMTGIGISANAMAGIGEDLTSNIALFTGGQEVIHDAGQVGEAIKSITLRTRGYDEENGRLSESLSHISYRLESLTKTAGNAQGISLFSDGTQEHYKGIVQYLGEVSDAWDSFSQEQQTDLLETLFGSNNTQAGAAIIQNFDQVRNALSSMENATGTADNQMENVRNSLSYNANALSQEWVETWQNMSESGDIVNVIKVLTKLSETVGVLLEHLGTVPVILGALGSYTLQKNGLD
ncbi:MAG: hypothetical protein HFG80_10105 [Eubacterium sp.]|nr:hypothetical protein [Eubacterium sp.]